MILANVIFPAPTAAYIACLFFPVAALLALATEFAVFVAFQRGLSSRFRLLVVVVGVNLLSWIVGLMFSCFLPTGLVPQLVSAGDHDFAILTQGPTWEKMAIASFFWACLLSFGIEYALLRIIGNRLRFRRLALCTGLANIASYCVIALVVSIHLHFDLF
jgi:hypothetical protein